MFRRISEVLNMTPDPQFVLNFANVNHISSVFIGLLMALRKKVDQRKGKITLISVNEQVMAVMHLTHIDQQFEIRQSAPSLDTTAAGLSGSSPGIWIYLAVGGAVIAVLLIWFVTRS